MTSRNETIFQNYLGVIDAHLADVLEGKVDTMFELRDVAKLLFIHPGHLSNVIKEHTGKHPCYFYEKKLLAIAKRYLEDEQYSVADVARILTYDPSNFTKWFRTYQGVTPSQYRAQLVKQAAAVA
ncbi:helix-turn-helix domain-containing protein [Paraflavitalea pollutisoli]|uniref:helix-turn-helix domain-containing protein n=1 Tax=Paraflavitalea pollutisoli TaxID=3034143 RepID=UPI0023EB7754|nr:AraC family transcriptional regulator [Paraflavitalea sp. H1-2-19X]